MIAGDHDDCMCRQCRVRLRRVGRDVREGRRVSIFTAIDLLSAALPESSAAEISAMASETIQISDYKH
jgi:hypothetical protein